MLPRFFEGATRRTSIMLPRFFDGGNHKGLPLQCYHDLGGNHKGPTMLPRLGANLTPPQ